MLISHLPRKVSHISSLSLKRGTVIMYTVTSNSHGYFCSLRTMFHVLIFVVCTIHGMFIQQKILDIWFHFPSRSCNDLLTGFCSGHLGKKIGFTLNKQQQMGPFKKLLDFGQGQKKQMAFLVTACHVFFSIVCALGMCICLNGQVWINNQ